MSSHKSHVKCDSLEIPQIEVIRVWDDSIPATWVLPSMSVNDAFPILWEVLHLIVSDWNAAVNTSNDSEIAPSNTPSSVVREYEKFERLKPRFIQALFSYINFFFTLQNGYCVFLSDMKDICRDLDITLRLPKHPKPNAYIHKLRRVRNHTVVHWGGPDQKRDIDSKAGRSWGFSWPANPDGLIDLQFGGDSLIGASDRQLLSMNETHRICTEHLREYDRLCVDVWSKLVQLLPSEKGTRRFQRIIQPKPAET